MRKSQQLLKSYISEAMLVKDRQMSNSLASSSEDAAGKPCTDAIFHQCIQPPDFSLLSDVSYEKIILDHQRHIKYEVY